MPTAAIREAKPLIRSLMKAIRGGRVPEPPKHAGGKLDELDPLVRDAAKALDEADAATPSPASTSPDPAPVSPTEGAVGAEAVPTSPMDDAMRAVDAEAETITPDQAQGLTGRQLSEYDLEDWNQLNFDRIDGEEDVQAMLAELANRNRSRISDERRGVLTDQAIAAMASDMGVRAEALERVMTREAGDSLNAEYVLAARQILNASGTRLHALATRITSGQATDMDKLLFRRQLAFHNVYQAKFMGARAEVGRALRAFRSSVMMDQAQAGELAHMTEIATGTQTEEFASRVALLTDPATGAVDRQAVNKAVRSPLARRLVRATEETFISFVLSGPKTLFVNFMGSPIMMGMDIVETAVAARVGQMERLFFGNQVGGVQLGEASAMLNGAMSGIMDGFRMGWRSMRSGQSGDGFVKYDMDYQPAISSENFDVAGPLGWFSKGLADAVRPAANRAVDLAGSAIRVVPERGMVPMDEFWKTIAYRAELARNAYAQTWTEVAAKQITPEQAAGRLTELMEQSEMNPMMTEAQAYAHHVTFQTPLGPLGRAAQSTLNQISLARIIAPFIKTPTNIFKEGVSRTPLPSLNMAYSMVSGGPEARQFISDPTFRHKFIARQALAGGTAGLIAYLTTQGQVSGAGPQNYEARRLMMASGWRPYSIRVTDPLTGDTYWQSYMRAEPFSFAIGITATLVEGQMMLDYTDPRQVSESGQYFDAAALVMGSMSQAFLDKTFMTGPMEFFEMMSDPDRKMKGWLERTGTAFLPYSSFQRQLRQINDPFMREAMTLQEKMANMQPGNSETLPLKLDPFGDPIIYDSGFFLQQWSPFPSSQEVQDLARREVADLAKTTNEAAITMPSRKVGGVLLSAQEYSDLVRLSRKDLTGKGDFSGMRFAEAIEQVILSPGYQLASPYGRHLRLREVQTMYDGLARDELRRLYPTIPLAEEQMDFILRSQGAPQ